MRGSDDPVMIFFFYPFVAAFADAILFNTVGGCLTAHRLKGLMFGGLLLTIMTLCPACI
jgi:hypothetical protein